MRGDHRHLIRAPRPGTRRATMPTAALAALLLLAAGCSSDDDATTTTRDGTDGTTATDGSGATGTTDGNGTGGPTEWAHFGKDLGGTRANTDESAIGPDEIASLEPAWTVEGLDGVSSTPAVVDGVVYVGAWNGEFLALDADTGEEIWTADIGSQMSDTPAVADDAVYIGDYGGVLHALSREDGTELWQKRLDEFPLTILFGSPIVVDDLVIEGVSSADLNSGGGDDPFVGSLVALDRHTGEEKWRHLNKLDDERAGAGCSIWAPLAVDTERHLVFAGTGNTYDGKQGKLSDGLIAVDYRTGERIWNAQFTDNDVFNMQFTDGATGPDSDVGITPMLYEIDGRAVVGVGDKAGDWWTLDRETGEVVWTEKYARGSRLGGFNASAAYHDGTLYMASNEGAEDEVTPGPTAVLVAADAANGETKWKVELAASAYGAVSWANDVVYVGISTGELLMFDDETGEELGRYEAPSGIGGGASIVNGTVYIGYGFWVFRPPEVKNGGLVALRPEAG